MQNARCKMQNQERIVRSNIFVHKRQLAASGSGRTRKPPRFPTEPVHFAFCILHFAFLFSPKKKKIALSYQDEKTRYHLISFFRRSRKRRSSTSDNGLKRRKLTGHLPLHLRRLTGDRSSYLQGLAPTVLSLSRSVKIPPDHSRRNMKSDPFSRVTGLRLRSTPTRRGRTSLRVDCISWS